MDTKVEQLKEDNTTMRMNIIQEIPKSDQKNHIPYPAKFFF